MNKVFLSRLMALALVVNIGGSVLADDNLGLSEKRVDHVGDTINTESNPQTFGSNIDSGVEGISLAPEDNNSSNGSNSTSTTDTSKNKEEKITEKATESVEEKTENQVLKTELEKFISSKDGIIRISGSDRIQTSIQISKFQNNTSEKVIIADARTYPDALAASNLTAGKYPVLLVGAKLSQATIDEIARLGASEVIILGGINSVSSSVEMSLKNIASVKNVKRIAGLDRFDTCRMAFEIGGKTSIVFASGRSFPDALTASYLTKDSGLLLTSKDFLPSSIVGTVNSVPGKNIKVVGGEGSISNNLVRKMMSNNGINNFIRFSGNNRFETGVDIASRTNSDTVILASGLSFPDALASSSLSQNLQAPIVLLSKDKIDNSVVNYFKNRGIKKAIVLGGEESISSNTMNNIDRLMKGMDIVQEENTATDEENKPVDNTNPLEENETVKSAPVYVAENLVKDTKLTGYQYLDGRYQDDSVGYLVTKSETKMYSNSLLEGDYISIPVKKIVDSLGVKNGSTKVRYNGYVGWVDSNNLKPYSAISFGKVVNKVPYISQLYPVYAPNGCEPTSMLMGLQGKGYTSISLRPYLDKVPKTKENPRYGYVGMPYNVEQGRFQTIDPEPLAKYGRKYGKVENIQGADIDKIIREIQNGNTVVAYETLYWNAAAYRTLYVEGKPMRRIWNNHVVLLTGYDPVNKSFYVADPYNHEKAGGNRRSSFYYWKDQAVVDRCYNYDNRRFAVVIR